VAPLAGLWSVPTRLQASIQRLRWLSLPIGLVLVGLSISLVGLGELPAFGTWRYALAWGAAPGLLVCSAIPNWWKHLISARRSELCQRSGAALPILHQMLLCVGYFVVQWAVPDLLKSAII
jgi:hypothetical protein